MDRGSGLSSECNSFLEREPKSLAMSSGVKVLNWFLDAAVAKTKEEVSDHDTGNSGRFVGPWLKCMEH